MSGPRVINEFVCVNATVGVNIINLINDLLFCMSDTLLVLCCFNVMILFLPHHVPLLLIVYSFSMYVSGLHY